MQQRTLYGDGTTNCPFVIKDLDGKRWEGKSLKEAFLLCRNAGIDRINVAYSGRYYELRQDEWYETSDLAACDKLHGMPPEGRKVKGV